jgi:acetate kinase
VNVASARTVLAINAGSSSVKCALFTLAADPQLRRREVIDGLAVLSVPRLIDWIGAEAGGGPLGAIGHRIVHGGPAYREPHLITGEVIQALKELIPLAPNHLSDAIALIEALRRARPEVPQVACFDTAFHADLPEVVRRLPIPEVYAARGVRRYGFHGLSYAFLLQELARLAGPAAANSRLILAHLGNGSSLAAVRDGRSVDTTMGFTPMGGVVMSTRSGDLDPGVVTYLLRVARLSADGAEELFSHEAGLLGISGVSGDMRALLERESGDPRCRLAVEMYAYSIRKTIGAFAASLGGLDTLVFSGGIGEHAAAVRARICDGLAFLGITLDADRNAAHAAVISASEAAVTVRVIPTDEELMVARASFTLLGSRDVS